MSEIHIPFVHGENAQVDEKLLPQGALALAMNVRFAKDARVVSRNGYALAEDSPAAPSTASVAWRDDRTLLFYRRDEDMARFRERLPDGSYTSSLYNSAGGMYEAARRTVAAPRVKWAVSSSDCVAVNGYLFTVYDDTRSTDRLAGALHYVVHERATMRIVASGTIAAYADVSLGYFNAKCIDVGTNALCVYRVDNDVRLFTFDTTTLASTGDVHLVSADEEAEATQVSFDICPYDVNQFALATCLNAADALGVSLYRVSAAGAINLVANTSDGGATTKRVGVCKVENGTFSRRWLISWVDDDGDVWSGSFSSLGLVVDTFAKLDDSGNARGAPCSSSSESQGAFVCWAVTGTPAGKMAIWSPFGGSVKHYPSVYPVSKPKTTPDDGDVIWTVDRTEADIFDVFGTYRLFDLGGTYSVSAIAGNTICEAVAAQQQALCGARYADHESFESQRHIVTVDVDTDRDEHAMIAALPILVGLASLASRVDFVEIRTGEFVDTCYPARLNGQLFLSGARLREFDGSQLYESGLFQGPGAVNISSEVGSIPAGTRFYKVIWKWFDAAGRVHRSQPTAPLNADSVIDSDFTLAIEPPPCTARNANGRPTVFAEIYRTIDNGTNYFLVNPNERPTFVDGLLTPLVYVDTATDATISEHERLYTDGDILDNEEPPPCCYLAAGEDRLLMAGLEDRSEYRFSKRTTQGLAVSFSTDTAFGGTVDGDIVGVGYLDGVFYLGTRDAIWAVTGDGPDDLGDGQFTRPRRLPSDCGFQGQRSIVETPQGLMFQGSNGRLYLLPRGGGAPVWVGQPVRDAIEGYPFVTWSQFIPEQNIVVFACMLHTAEATDGIFLVYDTRIGEWVRDSWLVGVPPADPHTRLSRCAALRSGKLCIDGRIDETDLWSDSDDGETQAVIPLILETGDVRPFGVQGDGRVRRMTLLGEGARSNFTLECSRDSGTTWDTLAGEFEAVVLTDLTYDLPHVRGCEFKFRITAESCNSEGATAPGQGAIINSMSLEVFPAAGTKRLGSGQKR